MSKTRRRRAAGRSRSAPTISISPTARPSSRSGRPASWPPPRSRRRSRRFSRTRDRAGSRPNTPCSPGPPKSGPSRERTQGHLGAQPGDPAPDRPGPAGRHRPRGPRRAARSSSTAMSSRPTAARGRRLDQRRLRGPGPGPEKNARRADVDTMPLRHLVAGGQRRHRQGRAPPRPRLCRGFARPRRHERRPDRPAASFSRSRPRPNASRSPGTSSARSCALADKGIKRDHPDPEGRPEEEEHALHGLRLSGKIAEEGDGGMKRILVTGGAGFLGSHLCEYLLEQGHGRRLHRQPLLRQQGQHPPPPRPPLLRVHPPRRHPSPLPGSRPDLPPGLPRLAHPLPAEPDQDHQDQRHGHDQHARAGQADQVPDPARLDLRGLRRRPDPPPAGILLGQREPHRPPQLLRRGQARRRDADDGLPPPEQGRHPHRPHLQHVRTADGRRRRPGGQQLHRPGAPGRADHGLRRRRADAVLLLRDGPDRRPGPDDGQRRIHRPGQPGQPGRIHDHRARRESHPADGHEIEDRPQASPLRRPGPAAAGYLPGAARARLGAQGRRWRKACSARSIISGGSSTST